MKITSHIAQHLLDVYTGGNWTEVSVAETLAGISFEDAVKVTPASPNSIASLVHHLHFWNGIIIDRIKGLLREVPDANGFDVGVLGNEAEWKALIKKMFVSASELAVAIKDVPEERLEEPILPNHTSAFKNLQGTVEHVHYHLGQMVIIKQLLAAR